MTKTNSKDILERPVIVQDYCPSCKDKFIKGDMVELRIYKTADKEKHRWNRAVCTHLFHVYKEDKAVLKTFREYYTQEECLKK